MSAFTSAEDAARFTLAGRAIVTVTSKVTGRSYTLRWRSSPYVQDEFFVDLLTGPHNTADYTYLGMFRRSTASGFVLTKRSKMNLESTPIRAVSFFTKNVLQRRYLPATLEVRHEGRCGRCARTLTVPGSIDRGIGPECAEILGII